MRAFFHVSCAILVLGCSTDTFVGTDSGGADASGDVAVDSGQPTVDGATEAGVSPINPNNLGNDLVLWLRAEDVVFDPGLKLASSWPDQSPYHRTIKLKSGTTPISACGTPGVYIHTDELGSYSSVSFCGAVAEAADAQELQFGSDAPFLVATVVEPSSPPSPDDCVLATKSSDLTQGGFALIAPNTAGTQAAAFLLQSDAHVEAAVSGVGQYHIVTMVRRKALNGQSTLTLRIDTTATNQSVPTQDVSVSGAPFTIGGLDTTQGLMHVIPGKVAEVLVVSNASSLPDALPAGIDLYLKDKYNL